MKITKIADGIMYYENAIPQWKEFIDGIENTVNSVIPEWIPWMEGEPDPNDALLWITNRDVGGRKKLDWDESYNEFGKYWPRKDVPIDEDHEKAKKIIDLVHEPLIKVLDHFYTEKNIFPKLEYISKNYDVRKFRTGQSINKHIDANKNLLTMDHSILIYLNDDYQDGELIFNDLDIKIKPSAGSIIIFDCDKPHESVPTIGNKYFIALFIHSRHKFVGGFREEYPKMIPLIEKEL